MDRGLGARVNGRSNMELRESLNVPEDRQYHPCPEAHPGPGVPRGTVREFPGWDGSRNVGSFVNIRGGHNYPYLIRSTPRKPLRVFLQSGARDGNIILGNWALANQRMASALEYAGYEYRFVFGEGGHSARHGGALFADSLRWLMG